MDQNVKATPMIEKVPEANQDKATAVEKASEAAKVENTKSYRFPNHPKWKTSTRISDEDRKASKPLPGKKSRNMPTSKSG